jgi:23S rRNA pseudouridine1911/1915/1917 synthase
MPDAPFPILYEDNHLLVVVKPAHLPTMGVAADKPSLLSIAKQYIKRKYNKPGNVYLGIVSRLDAPVTGLIVLARTSKAAARLSEQFRRGAVDKRYWALVDEPPDPPQAACVDFLRKDERHRKMHATHATHPEAKQARLRYRTLARLDRATLIEVQLETGRKHQIRVQLARRGWPIIGDRKYGSTTPLASGIALHARSLELVHPVQKTSLRLVAPLPSCWRAFGVTDRQFPSARESR